MSLIRRVLGAIGSAGVLLFCQPTPFSPVAPAPAGSLATAAATDPPELDANVTSTDGAEAAATVFHSDPTRFRCGTTRCKSGVETCCWLADERATCVASRGGAGPMSPFDACIEASLDANTVRADRCDESSDCAAGEACCAGERNTSCVPIETPGRTPCDDNEVCYDGQPCRAKGAECNDGICEKAVKNVPCNGATCSDKNGWCCGEPLGCHSRVDCNGMGLECAHPSDCLDGEYCWLYVSGPRCIATHQVAMDNVMAVCDRDSDCPTPAYGCPRMRCTQHDAFKLCECR